eukprot:1134296-Pyramimonas_sp.AAC.1
MDQERYRYADPWDVAHPGRCLPTTIRVLSRDLVSRSLRIYGSFDHSHPNTSRGQEDSLSFKL